MSDPSELKERLHKWAVIAACEDPFLAGAEDAGKTLYGEALSRIAKLEEALEPFCAAIAEIDEGTPPDLRADDDMPIEDALYKHQQPTVADFRRARAVRGGGEEEGNSLSVDESAARPNALPPASEVAGGGEP